VRNPGEAWPIGGIHLDGFAGKLEYAQFLHDASELRMLEGREARSKRREARSKTRKTSKKGEARSKRPEARRR